MLSVQCVTLLDTPLLLTHCFHRCRADLACDVSSDVCSMCYTAGFTSAVDSLFSSLQGGPWSVGGTAAAAPLPFRPGNPALCGSRPLVTPYYCRLGDLLCYTCMLYLCIFCVSMHVNFVFSLFFVLFSFVASFSTLILLVGSFDL